jgi:hypothetical protein
MELLIDAEWERLEAGPPEERACFAALGIRVGDVWLTEADDGFVKRIRERVHLSAYRVSEWLAWNWWRLRWEPRAHRGDWVFAHRMTTIGGGYVWPNITIISDGERVALLSKPTQPRATEPLRYLSTFVGVVRATEFEGQIDCFIDQVRGQLRAEHVMKTNLDDIWIEVLSERADPTAKKQRQLEAILGFDPDEAPSSVIEQLIADEAVLGQRAILEVAADEGGTTDIITAAELREVAATSGFAANPSDAACLSTASPLPPTGQFPAWRRGAEAAKALRIQEMLGAAPISNHSLARLAGVRAEALARGHQDFRFGFALDDDRAGRVVLRSKWESGRRFELARLLGDRIASATGDRLLPATRSYTYRQKLQRSFAAELLCPFEVVEDMLKGDYSAEAIDDAADHFSVSERTVRTLLVNHGRLEREDLEGDVEAVAAF